ncbi:MAG: hypothetical protein ACR2MY_04685 [Candidatus Dormibacteria bacterium]
MESRRHPFGAAVAAWAFVLPTLVGYVRDLSGQNVYLHTGEIGILCMLVLSVTAFVRGVLIPARVVRVGVLAGALSAVVAIYSWRWSDYHATSSFIKLALSFYSYLMLAVAYALFFYDPEVLTAVFRRAAQIALMFALCTYLIYVVGGPAILVHTQYGVPRLNGFTSEPSAWAPILGVLLLTGLHRRSAFDVVIALVGILAAQSPIVLVTAGTSVLTFYLLQSSSQVKRAIVVCVLVPTLPLTIMAVNSSNISRGPYQRTFVDQTFGRLASGIASIESGGTVGSNDRYVSLSVIASELAVHDLTLTGLGPGGAEVYFTAKYGVDGYQANSFLVMMFADFGPAGVALVVVLLVMSLNGIRRNSQAGRLFLPFLIAGMINSATGWEMYKFVVAGFVVLGIGWRESHRPVDAATTGLSSDAVGDPETYTHLITNSAQLPNRTAI